MRKLSVGAFVNATLLLFFACFFLGILPSFSVAKNIASYSDLITDSAPLAVSNHTFTFTVTQPVPTGSVLTIDFPAGFNLQATSSFGVRNVEMKVNGITRTSDAVAIPGQDGVTINTGDGGSIVYELNPTSAGLSAGDVVSVLVGNHTLNTIGPSYSYSTSTGTTTHPGDLPPVINAGTTGAHHIDLEVTGAGAEIGTSFIIVLLERVGVGPADTTETDPPERFNGLPEGQIGGTTLSVEISLETNEFAICKWSSSSSTPFVTNQNIMSNTGLIEHSHVVAVLPQQLNQYFIRCIDDEGNFNTDDFIIAFMSPPPPDGSPNADGEVEGDGTGTGNDGSGGGTGGGTSSSGSDGVGSTPGSTSGSGGSGGGGSGGSADSGDETAGGGFESSNGPYRSGDARVIINGYAFPGSTVYAIVDGYAADNVRASSDGKYALTIDEIARGAYTFGVYAVDTRGVKSSTFSTSFTVTGGRTSSLSNINIMPSILVDPDPVNPGEQLTLSGFSIPNANITIENQRDGSNLSKKVFTAVSDGGGRWSVEVDTGAFSKGTYKVKAKAVAIEGGLETDYSDYTFYGVGQEAENQINADLSRDGKVNLTDFSILLFWWGGSGGDSDPPADINQDGSVSLTDFSIMLFQWTG